MTAREDYQVFMEKQLNEWKSKTEKFKTATAQMEAESKAQYEQWLAIMHAKQDDAWQNFNKMKAASENTWEQFKANMDKAGEELKDAGERMTAQFKK